jgi:hypothetical protein
MPFWESFSEKLTYILSFMRLYYLFCRHFMLLSPILSPARFDLSQ